MKSKLFLSACLVWMCQGACASSPNDALRDSIGGETSTADETELPTISIFTNGEIYGSGMFFEDSRYEGYDDDGNCLYGPNKGHSYGVVFPGVLLGMQYNFGKQKRWGLDFSMEYISNYGVMLDQFSFTYRFLPELQLMGGLFCLPFGHGNTAYGYRDVFVAGDPEGELMMIPFPMAESGLALSGEFKCGFNYFFSTTTGFNGADMTPEYWAVAASQGFVPDDIGLKAPAFTLRLGYDGLEGFQCGAGFYCCPNVAANITSNLSNTLNAYRKTGKNALMMWYADAEYAHKWFTVRANYMQGHLNNATALSTALCDHANELAPGLYPTQEYFGYIASDVLTYMGEVGWNLKGCFYPDTKGPDLIPFAHYEYYNAQQHVTNGVADPRGKVNLWSFGLKWNPIEQVALKANYIMRKVGGQDRWNQNSINLGIAWDLTIFEK